MSARAGHVDGPRGPRPAGDGPAQSGVPAQRVWELMYRFVEAHDRRGELAEALGFRLGAGRGKALVRLRTGPMTLSGLAEAIGADAPYTTLVVDKLEAQGLVQRRTHPEDRRRKLVELTPAGYRAVTTVDAILRRPPRALDALPDEELELLGRLLARLSGADEPERP